MSLSIWIALGALAFCGVAFWASIRMAQRSGAAQEAVKQERAALDAIAEHKEVRDRVRDLPDDDARKRLREWAPPR